MKSTGERLKILAFRGPNQTGQQWAFRTLTRTVWESPEGVRCIKMMGRGCWSWWRLHYCSKGAGYHYIEEDSIRSGELVARKSLNS